MLLQVNRIALAVIALGLAGAAVAQRVTPPPRGSAVARGSAIVTPAESIEVKFTQRTGRSGALVGEGALNTEVKGVPLLSGFRLSFNNGDHKVRRLGVENQGQVHITKFADNNLDDPFAATVVVWDAEGPAVKTAKFETRDAYGAPDYLCYGFDAACRFSFQPSIVSDEAARQMTPLLSDASLVPIISGFNFERQDTDANVRDVGVRFGCDTGGCNSQIGLVDSAGYDGRYIAEGKALSARNVMARVSYALVPRRNIQTCQTLSGGRKPNTPDPAIRQPVRGDPRSQTDFRAERVPLPFTNAKIVLQSFSFSFLNGDHHLQDIGVEYEPSGALYLTFGDGTRDDPYSWTIGYCVLKG